MIAARASSCAAEVAAGRGYLPGGRPRAARVRAPAGRRARAHRGAGPLPDARARGRPVASRVAPDVRPVPRSLPTSTPSSGPTSGCPPRRTGDLTPWAEQGVLLLNRVLTVRPGQPASHRGKGWETVTAQRHRRPWSSVAARSSPSSGDATRAVAGAAPARRRAVHRVAAPVSPLSAHAGLLRLAAVQPRQRPARPAGRRTHRLEAAMTQPAPDIPADGLDPLRRDRRLLHRGHVRRRPDHGRTRTSAGPTGSPHQLERSPQQGALPFGYANLAVRGRKLADVVGPQLDAALAMQPDLVSHGRRRQRHPAPQGRPRRPRRAARGGRGPDPARAAPTCCWRRRSTRRTPGSSRPRAAAHADPHRQHLHHRPAARLLRPQPVGPARAARLADVGRGPHPPHHRGAPPGRARRAHGPGPRAPTRPTGHPAAAGRPAPPGDRSCAPTRRGRASTSGRGCSGGCRAGRAATRSAPSGPRALATRCRPFDDGPGG